MWGGSENNTIYLKRMPNSFHSEEQGLRTKISTLRAYQPEPRWWLSRWKYENSGGNYRICCNARSGLMTSNINLDSAAPLLSDLDTPPAALFLRCDLCSCQSLRGNWNLVLFEARLTMDIQGDQRPWWWQPNFVKHRFATFHVVQRELCHCDKTKPTW